MSDRHLNWAEASVAAPAREAGSYALVVPLEPALDEAWVTAFAAVRGDSSLRTDLDSSQLVVDLGRDALDVDASSVRQQVGELVGDANMEAERRERQASSRAAEADELTRRFRR